MRLRAVSSPVYRGVEQISFGENEACVQRETELGDRKLQGTLKTVFEPPNLFSGAHNPPGLFTLLNWVLFLAVGTVLTFAAGFVPRLLDRLPSPASLSRVPSLEPWSL